MSAVIQNEYTGNGSTTTYSFTFPYLKTSDIKASLDGVVTTAFTLPSATTLQFNTAPTNGAIIRIFRETSVDSLTATFYAGSAIKSEDLNDNFTQNLYKTQEVGARSLSTLGGTMSGDLNIGYQADINFEGTTEDGNDTTLTVVDPTANQTYRLPNNSAGTYNLVSTGDTGTVARGMIAADAVDGTKLADNAVNSEHYTDGSIDRVHLAADIVDGTKIADDSVDSEHLVADSIDTEHYAAGSVDATALGSNAVTRVKIIADAVDGTKIADNSIDSEHYVNGSIDNEHIADNAINQAKMADDSIGAAEIIDNAVGSAALASNSVTNLKMADNAIGTSELVNDAVVADKIAANAVTRAKIIADAVDGTKIADNAIGNEHLQDDSVRSAEIQAGAVGSTEIASNAIIEAKIADDAVTTNKIANNAVTTGKIEDGELKTLAGMVSATASKLAEAQTLTADINDLNIVDGMTKQTTISDTDASYPTSGAVVDYVAAQIAPLGGLEVIANEDSFPTTQPSAGVVISISDIEGLVTVGGTSTTARTSGNGSDNVTINGFPSSLQGKTMAAGLGLMVSSTGSGQVYNYHKLLAKEADVEQLSNDINDFAARYRVGSSNPTSDLDAGDLFFNTSTSKLLVYNATNTAWEEAQSIGNFYISTLSPAFNGSVQDFTITNAPTNAEQILLSINGVVQKPNAGTSTPSEGFALSGSTVKLAAAPASGSDYFAIVLGSTVNIGTPSANTVTSAILQNGSVITTKIADDAVDATKLANTTVTAGSYGSSTSIPSITVDAQGRITAASGNTVNTDLVGDTSPQLGGDLDLNSNDITGTGNINITGELTIGGSDLNMIGSSDGNRYFDARVGTDSLQIRATSGGDSNHTNMAKFFGGGAVELYHAGTKKFETSANGLTISGNPTINGNTNANGHITLPDHTGSQDGKLRLGTSNDLQIYHDGTDNFITTSNGHLNIYGDGTNEIHIKGVYNEESIKVIPNGGVELYHDNYKNFETIEDGCVFDNDATNLTLYLKANNSTLGYVYAGPGNEIGFKTASNQWGVQVDDGAEVALYHAGNKKLETTSTGVLITCQGTDIAIGGNDSIYRTASNMGGIHFSTQSVLPANNSGTVTNNGIDLGSSSYRWRNIYTNDLCLSNEGSSNDVDGSWGDWTIQEGESDLFLKNNRSGKKYKFNLTEVS